MATQKYVLYVAANQPTGREFVHMVLHDFLKIYNRYQATAFIMTDYDWFYIFKSTQRFKKWLQYFMWQSMSSCLTSALIILPETQFIPTFPVIISEIVSKQFTYSLINVYYTGFVLLILYLLFRFRSKLTECRCELISVRFSTF